MYPILFKIGPLTLHTYGLFIALGFIAGILLAMHFGRQQGIDREKILDIGFYCLLSAIFGTRLLYVLIEYEYFIKKPLDIFKVWEGGLVFFGVFLVVPFVLFFYFKKHSLPLWKTFDTFTPSLSLGHAIGRIGCFFAGCCYGKHANLPWAVTFNNSASMAELGIPLHPTQLYESGAEFLIFTVLLLWRRHKKFDGQVFWTYIMLYSIARFTIEFFRGDKLRGFLFDEFSVAQGICVLLFTLAAIILIRNRKKTDSLNTC